MNLRVHFTDIHGGYGRIFIFLYSEPLYILDWLQTKSKEWYPREPCRWDLNPDNVRGTWNSQTGTISRYLIRVREQCVTLPHERDDLVHVPRGPNPRARVIPISNPFTIAYMLHDRHRTLTITVNIFRPSHPLLLLSLRDTLSPRNAYKAGWGYHHLRREEKRCKKGEKNSDTGKITAQL